jgi:Protein of unknown function (DUF3037)
VAELRQCEFFLVRYVPDPVKNEFVNIGVVLRDLGGVVSPGEGRPDTAVVRFTRDWGRVRCVDPEADVSLFEALESDIRRRLGESSARPDVQPVMSMIEDSFSNALQMTSPKACLAESMAAEVENLLKLYVETRKRPKVSRVTGRQTVYGQMRNQFERAGVWDLMRKRIAAAEYTRPGDPLRIDCGYRPNGVVRMFQAISLESDADDAKLLAFSALSLVAGVKRVEKADLELTAIVEPIREVEGDQPSEERIAQYRFGVEIMEEHTIRVMTSSDLPRIAETARRELRV